MKRILYLSILLVFHTSLWAQTELLDGFSQEWLDLDFENPVGIAYDDLDRMMVWEKGGKVWYVINEEKATEPLLDISDEVGNYGDVGMLGFTTDPDFLNNGYIYVFYVVDFHHLMFAGTSLYDPDANLYEQATITRCTRYTVNDIETNPTVDYASRKILLGEGPGSGPSSMFQTHIGGAIDFGEDGTLLLATGDGSGWEGPYYGDGPPYLQNYVEQGLADEIISQEEEVGALRAQQKGSLNGKILRIDPSTGEGVSSNPFYDPINPNSNESKIWALGFRNPFKLIVRPGSGFSDPSQGFPGVAYVGDVGNGLWEEVNIVRKAGENFGWPLYEGCDENVVFPSERPNQFAANPLYQLDGCESEFFTFEELLKQDSKNAIEFKNPCNDNESIADDLTFIHSRPALNLAHITAGFGVYFGGFDEDGNAANVLISDESSPIEGDFDNLRSRCIIGGDFYGGNTFPEQYNGAYFFADYNVGWIKYLEYDLNDSITAVKSFFTDTIPIVDLSVNPSDGCLYVIHYMDGFSRICYDDNLSPKAIIQHDVSYGPAPLTVNFDGSASFDPQGESIVHEWDFGDNTFSDQLNPSHTFQSVDNQPQSFEVSLKVTDEINQTKTEKVLISVNNTPPDVRITGIEDGVLYNMTGLTEIKLEAEVIDQEHGASELHYRWIWSLHHNTHNHPEPVIESPTGVVTLLPAGCEGEVFFYGLELTVQDANGLVGRDEVFVYPDCESKYVELLSFRAELIGQEVICSWSTHEENGVQRYEIERDNGKVNYVNLGGIDANNQDGAQDYAFTDSNVIPGLNFYRIKMISEEGAETYSERRVILFAEPNEIFVYPNPVINEMQIFYGKLNNEATVEIFNVEGKIIRRFEVEGNGSLNQTVNLGGINPGNYIYRIKNGDLLKTGKFVIIQ